ncbi:MAG TPA: alpha/beta hydrolase-fold protein [Pyrinomonadaceae bacterium]|nr:alpha/beta hydrolase-fold protein [Pyrinomonadaceae bacterium]
MIKSLKIFAIIALILLTGNLCPAQDAARSQHTLAGEFRTHNKFHSRYLADDRDVIVYLPPGYDTDVNRRYPVFYLHDGQNLFDGAASFIPGMEWRVDETAQALIQSGAIEPLIIVGIYNAGNARMDEYTPTRSAKYSMGGKADSYGRMLVEELKPFIDSHYRTKRDAVNTGLGGSSLGGLVSLYLGLKYPNVFGKLAVISPSVFWDNRTIVRDVLNLNGKPALRIWLDIGTHEGGNEEDYLQTAADARLLHDALVAKGWRDGRDLSFLIAEGAVHNEQAWAARVEAILKFLFPGR